VEGRAGADIGRMFLRRMLPIAAIMAASAAVTPAAHASLLLTRNAHTVTMAVWTRNGTQMAEATYAGGGSWHHVLAWDAVDARIPSHTRPQVAFRVDYSGGYGSFRNARLWSTIKAHNQCRPDPAVKAELHWAIFACTMTTDGSHWALQNWQRDLPNGGQQPAQAMQRAWELHVSHWTGRPTVIWMKWDWAYVGATGGPFDHVYGEVSFHGHGVYGFTHTLTGVTTDSYGRNVYVDVRDPTNWRTGYRQPAGWYRWNGFLAEDPLGNFCAGVFANQFGRTVVPHGDMYRATVIGPGVAPDAFWQGGPPGRYQPGRFVEGDYLMGTLPAPLERAAYNKTDNALLSAEQRELARMAPVGSDSYRKCATTH
jgi:hypothetical protein